MAADFPIWCILDTTGPYLPAKNYIRTRDNYDKILFFILCNNNTYLQLIKKMQIRLSYAMASFYSFNIAIINTMKYENTKIGNCNHAVKDFISI
jgi:hypothetical protein